MGSAIWSMGVNETLDFPFAFFAKFFTNHGLLDIKNRPQWYTIDGGSRNYIPSLTRGYADKISTNNPVKKVRRFESYIEIELNDGSIDRFDQIIFACHSDQALGLLEAPTLEEQQILGSIKYSNNTVVVHTDSNLLPRRKLAYASWNYIIGKNSANQSTVTYNMNILQGLKTKTIYCVTLNNNDLIDKNKILAEYNYSHPVYSQLAIKAQKQWHTISGHNNTHYCGAYWANGFHEDGVVSAIAVCKSLGLNNV